MTAQPDDADRMPAPYRPGSGRRWPFVPCGLAPLLVLIAVFIIAWAPFAVGEIEAATNQAAQKALRDAGAGWATANVSGQMVTLEGKPPSREAAEAALNAVRKATAPTVFGDLQAAEWVSEHFTWAEEPLTGGGLRQRGGTTPDHSVDAAPAPTPAAAATCDKTMSDLLGAAKIEFPTGSAYIGQASKTLLDNVATAAKACPGVLSIEGYTDNVGADDNNMKLSRDRASAVREALIARGIAGQRLIAQGFGAGSPLADNGAETGRARNRRIEIRVLRSSTPPTPN